MTNPLSQLESAAKGAVENVIKWGLSNKPIGKSHWYKSDQVLREKPLDTLRRAAYHNIFDTLFKGTDDFPYVTPDDTIRNVIGKLSSNVFPKGTAIKANDEKVDLLLQQVFKDTNFQLKTESIVMESALMGYCGLRSFYDPFAQKWLLEVKPKEFLIIETVEGQPEEILAIGMEWPVERVLNNKRVTFWNRERWTKEYWEFWPEKREEIDGRKPTFKREDAFPAVENTYGEIPITIIPHVYSVCEYGVGVVNESEILNAKSMIRLRHKRHYGHLKYMDPNPVIKNRTNPGEPISMGIGEVIDIQAGDPNLPVDMTLLEFAGMPESVKEEMYETAKAIYGAAGLKAPPPEEVLKLGNDQSSGTALRVKDKDDAKTIEMLRDNGYSQVLRHFEKILRMGKNLNLHEYGGINIKNDETWTITAKFPVFFPPTDEEIGLKLANMKAANLPTEIQSPIIAGLFGIDDPEQIAAIQKRLEEQEIMQAEALTKSFNAGR